MSTLRARATLVLLALVAAGAAWADRSAADFLCDQADKALAKGAATAAAEGYRKALAEEEGHLRARLGLGEALLASGDKAGAVDELRTVAAAADRAGLPAAWAGLPARAKKRLQELDPVGTQLDQVVDRRVSDLLAYADRAAVKNPLLARRAIDRVLALRPGHARAFALLEKMGMPPPGVVTVLFDGTSVAGWQAMHSPEWTVGGGVLRVTMPGEKLVGTESTVSGDFSVRMEARILQETGEHPVLALVAPLREDHQSSSFGVMKQALVWQEIKENREPDPKWSQLLTALPVPVDPREWNVYEMRFRPDRVEGVVNGRVVTTQKRLPLRQEGRVALHAAAVRAEIRRIELEVRPTK